MSLYKKTQKMFTDIDQLYHEEPLQLGTVNHPCKVIFGPSKFDEGKKYRAIKVKLAPDQMTLFEKFDAMSDDMHPFIKLYKGNHMVTVKVEDEMCDPVTFKSGAHCLLIVHPVQWEMNGTRGISLRCMKVKPIVSQRVKLAFI